CFTNPSFVVVISTMPMTTTKPPLQPQRHGGSDYAYDMAMPVAVYVTAAPSLIPDLVIGFILLSWGVSVYFGAEIGNSKGRLLAGIILSLCASWLGVLILVCLDNEKRRRLEDQRHAELMAALSLPIGPSEAPLPTDFARFSTPGLPVEVPRFRVARRGKDLGVKSSSCFKRRFLPRTTSTWMPHRTSGCHWPGFPASRSDRNRGPADSGTVACARISAGWSHTSLGVLQWPV
ncbi:hypothetical protein ACFQ5Q_20630, partial [Luteolibacter ambystomatis]|uniref:hypothetical protein n=1 Tax=Luteolibacter ambystomatis TaxID=2824561 RepID=UPI003633F6E3